MRAKQLWYSLVVTLGIVSGVFGIINDAPKAINEKMPEWLHNPDFWWIVSISVVGLVALVIIWMRPVANSQESVDHTPQTIVYNFFSGKIHEIANETHPKNIKARVEHALTISVPTLIASLLGTRERDRYLGVIEKTEQNHKNDLRAILDAANSHLYGMASRSLFKILKESQERLKKAEDNLIIS